MGFLQVLVHPRMLGGIAAGGLLTWAGYYLMEATSPTPEQFLEARRLGTMT